MSERFPPDDPREWLNRARSNLIQAKTLQASVYLEDLCFNAQQAAEKAIKAVLIHQGVEFPYIHDLTELLRLVQGAGEQIPDSVKRAGMLSRFAIFTRYPGTRPVSHEEYEEAVKIAEEVLRWAESILRNKND
ncbi:MAG: HEPN domain-containing protein [candidate division NC10 bacterium]|nr:HEPN domain-containing protein [candidate division NC10 bacterium]